MKHDCDMVLVTTSRNLDLLEMSSKYLRQYLAASQYVCIEPSEIRNRVVEQGVQFLDEDSVYPGLSLKRVKEILVRKIGNPGRGAIPPAVFKMAYCFKIDGNKYIIWDADTIPLLPYHYEKSDNQLVFMVKREYYKPYFDTISKLFGGEIGRYDEGVSFIVENMVIDCAIMREMISLIESGRENAGKKFL